MRAGDRVAVRRHEQDVTGGKHLAARVRAAYPAVSPMVQPFDRSSNHFFARAFLMMPASAESIVFGELSESFNAAACPRSW